MAKSIGEIVEVIQQRRISETPLQRHMIEIARRYNGDMALPFPDVEGNPAMKPPVPNIIAEAIDMGADRANSTDMTITSPQKDQSPRAKQRADEKRKALYGRLHESQVDLKRYRAYRHLIGYGTFAMSVMPDQRDGHAVIDLKDPLTAYPELRWQDDVREPLDCGFVFARSAQWIKNNYANRANASSDAMKFIDNATNKGRTWDTLWDCIEWIDQDQIVLGILGPRYLSYGQQESQLYAVECYELSRYANQAECVPVVAPRRLTMDRVQGQLTSLIETSDLFGRVAALDLMAMERSIFPDLVIISKTGGPPQIYSGDWHDGRSGIPNELSDAEVQWLESTQGPGGAQVIDTLERGLRSTGGALGADDAAGMRTGAGVGALTSFAADPRMIESQKIMQRAHDALGTYIQKVEKGYAEPKTKYFVFSGLRGDDSFVDYDPQDVFAFEPIAFTYPFPGLDAAQLNVATVQLEGSKILSRREARDISPFVSDSAQSEMLSNQEAIDDSILAGIQARAEQDPTFLPVAAHIRQLIGTGKTISDAVTEAMAVMQQQQPAPAPGGTPDAQSGLTPDQQRMLMASGQSPGAPSTIAPPEAGLSNEQKLARAISAQPSPTAV